MDSTWDVTFGSYSCSGSYTFKFVQRGVVRCGVVYQVVWYGVV